MKTTYTARRRALGALAAVSLVALTAACGSDAQTSSGSGGSGPSISISSPHPGDTVSQPFDLVVESSEELGATDTGKDHFHLTFDGNSQDYTVETSPKVRIDSLSPGKHTIKVTLQHADHSPVGPEAQVSVTVGNTGSGDSGGSGGLGY